MQHDWRNLSRAQGTLNKQLNVRSIVNHVNILVTQLAHDSMNTWTLHTNTSTYRIDTVIVRLNCNFCTFARNTRNFFNGNQSVVNFGNFHLEQALQKHRWSTAQNNFWIIVLIVYTSHYSTSRFAFTVEIARNLFSLGKQQFIAFIIEQQDFLLPNLINFRTDYSTYPINIFVV